MIGMTNFLKENRASWWKQAKIHGEKQRHPRVFSFPY